MAIGGFLYAQANTTPFSKTTFSTCADWAAHVHGTRCAAFLKATARGTSGQWTPVTTGLYNELTWMVGDVVQTFSIKVQDMHPHSIDTNDAYPAYVSFFKDPDSDAEYCIITANGFNSNNSYATINASNLQYGLHIANSNVLFDTSSYSYLESSLLHAFASNGFGSYDIANSSFLTTDCTFISPAYAPYYGSYMYGYGVNAEQALIGGWNSASYLNTYSFTFGYAVRGTEIEAFFRRSDRSAWRISLIGDILGSMSLQSDTHTAAAICFQNSQSYETDDVSIALEYTSNYENGLTTSMCKTDGTPYIPSQNSAFARSLKYNTYSGDVPIGMPCVRTNNTVPSDIDWIAVPCGVCAHAYKQIGNGVDDNGNGFKGWFDTDLVRCVAGQLCQISGTTFGNGTFVSSFAGDQSRIGYIFGWDPSNPSIVGI